MLAGDIGTGTAGIHWARRAFPDTPVLYILGNHEFYGYDWKQLIDEAASACDGTNVHLLENDSFHFRGIRFLGASLWTNFLLSGNEARPQAMAACESYINDYRHIRSSGRQLCARETLERHEESAAWLKGELRHDTQTTVVITHHAPCLAARHPRYPLDFHSNVFFSDLGPEYFRTPEAWVFGHTHYSLAGVEHLGTKLFSNQRGYPRERVDFDWCRTFEIRPRPGPKGSAETGAPPHTPPSTQAVCRRSSGCRLTFERAVRGTDRLFSARDLGRRLNPPLLQELAGTGH